MGKQVLDIEQMKHLQELGLDTSNASAYWYRIIQNKGNGNIKVISDWKLAISLNIAYCTGHTLESIPAFTLQDIWDLLPKSTKYGQLQIRFCEYPNGNYGNEVVYDSMAHNGVTFFCENVIDSAYEMLCLCIKEGFVKTNKED